MKMQYCSRCDRYLSRNRNIFVPLQSVGANSFGDMFAAADTFSGLTGFDSRQSRKVSMPSFVWGLVNLNAQKTNGNNSYALAA